MRADTNNQKGTPHRERTFKDSNTEHTRVVQQAPYLIILGILQTQGKKTPQAPTI
jgi:hypothetical protein